MHIQINGPKYLNSAGDLSALFWDPGTWHWALAPGIMKSICVAIINGHSSVEDSRIQGPAEAIASALAANKLSLIESNANEASNTFYDVSRLCDYDTQQQTHNPFAKSSRIRHRAQLCSLTHSSHMHWDCFARFGWFRFYSTRGPLFPLLFAIMTIQLVKFRYGLKTNLRLSSQIQPLGIFCKHFCASPHPMAAGRRGKEVEGSKRKAKM